MIRAHGELSKTCRHLSATGFELFKARIAALGLSEFKAQTLYNGSADFTRFQAPADPPSLQDLKSLWHHEDGRDQRFYVDQPVSALACNFTAWTARNTELQKLLADGQKELAKARKVAA